MYSDSCVQSLMKMILWDKSNPISKVEITRFNSFFARAIFKEILGESCGSDSNQARFRYKPGPLFKQPKYFSRTNPKFKGLRTLHFRRWFRTFDFCETSKLMNDTVDVWTGRIEWFKNWYRSKLLSLRHCQLVQHYNGHSPTYCSILPDHRQKPAISVFYPAYKQFIGHYLASCFHCSVRHAD